MIRTGFAPPSALSVLVLLAPWVLAACTQAPAPAVVRGQAAVPAPPAVVEGPPPAALPAGAVAVAAGDTVYGIARRYGVPIRAVIEANDLRPPYVLRIGQRLVLPTGRYHTVKPGETAYAISRLYDVDVHGLMRLNRIKAPYTITVGQRLLLPGAYAPAAVAATTRAPVPPAPAPRRPAPEEEVLGAKPAPAKVPPPPARSAGRFAWPVVGPIISGFGPKPGGLYNDGINISGPAGAPVRAAENGVVAYAGNELRGFGNLLLVRHAGGWTTAYAHNEQLLVERGDTVKRGQIIGRVGNTGQVRTPQLHFEIRQGEKAVDPLRLLGPKPRTS